MDLLDPGVGLPTRRGKIAPFKLPITFVHGRFCAFTRTPIVASRRWPVTTLVQIDMPTRYKVAGQFGQLVKKLQVLPESCQPEASGPALCRTLAITVGLIIHRCQPSRNRAGNPANLVVSRIPAFFPKHPAFLGFFGGEKIAEIHNNFCSQKDILCF